MDYAEYHDEQSTLLFLNICKGFDFFKWEFIFKLFLSVIDMMTIFYAA